MPAVDKLKNVGKKIVDYPEESAPIVSSGDWIKSHTDNPKNRLVAYLYSLFPILGWITRYNTGWLMGDVISGVTVGMVLVPQGMSYATIATLPVQYGLYSSFVGVLIYPFFATSKDVSIGPVAVMSLTISQIILHVQKAHPGEWEGPQIATTTAFICGFIVLGIGLLRLGWIVEFIPLPAVSGFMTGSAINIAAGQVPGLMGITGFNTRAATYKVIINTLKGLPGTTRDAAFGLFGLTFLYAVRIACDKLAKRYPRRARIFFFISVLRNGFAIIILTVAAWLYTRHRKNKAGKYPIKILGTVPRGFQHVGIFTPDSKLVSALAGELPVATIILLLEHIAISKSFGRINNYKINPNQELIAIGVTNTIGSVFGAYPATGSFSRSALKSKSGVRTPLAGIFTAIVVIVALYGLTPAFFFIPTAGLSAVIIHAVADLVAKPAQVYSFWRVSPLEFFIWAAAVLVTIFTTIENGIYTSIIASVALLLLRIAHPRGHFLGKVTLEADSRESKGSREVFVPLTPDGVNNPEVKVQPPTPGIIVYRFEESLLFPNQSLLNDALVDHVKAHTRRGKDMSNVSLSDRPWNDPGPSRHGADVDQEVNNKKPTLHAVVLDFSTVSHIDTTSIQSLVDTRNQVERWADRPVEFHFATVLSPWIRRALIAGGFGLGVSADRTREVAAFSSYAVGETEEQDRELRDIESRGDNVSAAPNANAAASSAGKGPLYAVETPFIHFDLARAVGAAELTLGSRGAGGSSGGLSRVSSNQDVKEANPQ
ncbi:sulfate permease [Athelia psychrophila]|uniref:Sulfate permease n=1 Tax=Athelia psychrophila TaxID=1759441 RepID=A0A166N7A9_9AGAM|nr:sulfate permease [Fibularhizoctonia sp. CBS 109695]